MTPVIFDLDGTLIDSAPSIHKVANDVLAEMGLAPLDVSQITSFIGNGAGVLVARVLAAHGLAEDAGLHRWMLGEFSARYEREHGLTRPYPGALAALEVLAEAGHRLAICTNKPIRPTRSALAHFDLARLFGAVIGGDSLATRKPDPAPLLAAAGEARGGDAVFVGDSEVDAETAERAGLPFALFTGGYRKAPPEAIPHQMRFDHHADLPGVVAEMSRRRV
jgi:phosphoglycolate phosphatase